MGQLPNEPEDTEDAGEIFVEGPDGQRLKLALPDLGERPERPHRERRDGDTLFGR